MTSETLIREMQKAAVPQRDSRPSMNRQEIVSLNEVSALRHQAVQALHERFLLIHSPETHEEMQLVERLAIAQSKLDEAQEAWDERVRWQMEHAAELHDRAQFERFRADMNAWRNDPHAMRMVFGRTWNSASFLHDLWSAAGMALKSDPGLSFRLVRDMILSQCGDWRVDRIDPSQSRIMSCILALQPDAAKFMQLWVSESRAGRDDVADIEQDRIRARAILASAPSPDDAKRILRQLVEKETKSWSERAEKLLETSMRERKRYAEMPPPHALGGAADVRETHRIRRALALAESRFEKLERRLQKLLKLRRQAKPTPYAMKPSANGPKNLFAPEIPDTEPIDVPGMELELRRFRSLRSQALEQAPEAPPKQDETTVADSQAADQESALPRQPGHRRDPKSVAKRWRAKQGNAHFHSRNRSSRSKH